MDQCNFMHELVSVGEGAFASATIFKKIRRSCINNFKEWGIIVGGYGRSDGLLRLPSR